MKETDVRKLLGGILYNYCFHKVDIAEPLSSKELELLVGDKGDSIVRRTSYCEILLWVEEHPEFDYCSALLVKRKGCDSKAIHKYLIRMKEQLDVNGVFALYTEQQKI